MARAERSGARHRPGRARPGEPGSVDSRQGHALARTGALSARAERSPRAVLALAMGALAEALHSLRRARPARTGDAQHAARIAAERARLLGVGAPAVRGLPIPVLPLRDLAAPTPRRDRTARTARSTHARQHVPPGPGRVPARAPAAGAPAVVT